MTSNKYPLVNQLYPINGVNSSGEYDQLFVENWWNRLSLCFQFVDTHFFFTSFGGNHVSN